MNQAQMKYFIDTEFLEGTQKIRSWVGWVSGETVPTIDLISIGIVAEDGREFYAISREFNLKEAWNRYDLKPDIDNGGMKKVYWVRDNVLIPMLKDLLEGEGTFTHGEDCYFTYKVAKKLINKYGKTIERISEDIKDFVSYRELDGKVEYLKGKPEFYGYYCDYDWVVFCWLFGKMNDLPKGFPMYCKDLKQEMDRIIKKSWKDVEMSTWGHTGIENIERLPNYPKQTNEHNALADARWNFELYKFLQNL
jgi:hypothetical protein